VGQRDVLFISFAIESFGMNDLHPSFFMMYFVNFVVSRCFQYKIDSNYYIFVYWEVS
jgi:hypothetical protein